MAANIDAFSRAREGHEALRRGDAAAAREHFRQATDAGQNDAETWLGLAAACRDLKDLDGAGAAVERALALEPRSFRVFIVRADIYAAAGNVRAASSFYTAALRQAPAAARLPPHLADEIERARRMCERYTREYESHLMESLAKRGFDPARSSARFVQSLDLIAGRKKIYLQQPRYYYFPGLPQIQFYERDAFPWLEALESATEDIVAELRGVLRNAGDFRPYVEKVVDRPRPDDARMTDNNDWTAFYLWKNGNVVPENASRCPKTMKALESLPKCTITGRAPSILFSQLRPGARIPPHNGFINVRLIGHLGLIVPEGCGFRVGNETRAWKKGKAWVFDDTIEHEAWNDSRETRIILLFEIWRPELSQEERALVSALMEAIDSHGGERVVWTA